MIIPLLKTQLGEKGITQTMADTTIDGKTSKYDPKAHLVKVKGGLYLPVKDRLVWLRADHPTARVTTQLLHYFPDKELYIVHARVELENGSVGDGLGMMTQKGFPAGPLERAETKALGRALAAIGLGTAWALELDDEDTFADAPVETSTPVTVSSKSAAGVEELRESVIAALEQDLEAKERLPKGPGQMTEEELTKTQLWLRQRALARA